MNDEDATEVMMNKIQEKKRVWLVIVNTDLTEGRGRSKIIYVCNEKATALRLGKGRDVQGSDAYIKPSSAYKINEVWFSPGPIEEQSRNDKIRQAELDKAEEAIRKAIAAGLTKEEIETIRNHN